MTTDSISIDQLKQLLEPKLEEFDVLLAPKSFPSGVRPFWFTKETGLDDLALWPWYRWPDILAMLQCSGAKQKIAVLVRGCDERALIEMHKRHQVDMNAIELLGIPCSASDELPCWCSRPAPDQIIIGEKEEGNKNEDLDEFLKMETAERLAFWRKHMDRCIKCYGCRNSCPLCICEPCKLEDDVWVQRGVVPAETITFHLIRACHLSDTCVACGACQEACPVNIPLLYLQLGMRKTLREKYGYEAGLDPEIKSPVLSSAFEKPDTDREFPDWINSLREKDES